MSELRALLRTRGAHSENCLLTVKRNRSRRPRPGTFTTKCDSGHRILHLVVKTSQAAKVVNVVGNQRAIKTVRSPSGSLGIRKIHTVLMSYSFMPVHLTETLV